MYFVYILQSQKDQGFYIGFTSNLEKRIKEHNAGKT
ncbi:MAG: GIY-YIG nuclease family protein, partial [Candidatus Marinimicrobia bacterium]|nr:GIY-YIG nuclease family protein [Candidatus Neomarinimicrobiota bacterium]